MFSPIVGHCRVISLKESILRAIAIAKVITCKQAYTRHDGEEYNCQYYPRHTSTYYRLGKAAHYH